MSGADLSVSILFTLISSSTSFALPRFCWLSVVIACLSGGSCGDGGLGGLFALLDLEAIL